MSTPKKLRIRLLGDPVLRSVAQRVKSPRHPTIRKIVRDLVHTFEVYGGGGLSAPQVGHSLRIIVVGIRSSPRYPDIMPTRRHVMINPVFLTKSYSVEDGPEGCVSLPGLIALKVPRHASVRIQWTTPGGRVLEGCFTGTFARIIQHEMDHLDGLMFTDRLKNNKSLVSWKGYEKLCATDNVSQK